MSDKLVTYAAGFKAGATAMREAAAKRCDEANRQSGITYAEREACMRCAITIRALALPEPEK